ncbi:prenyltransferase/squalene oxidase repeat-containing protein [Saccharopolyspora gregorii]|uniref:Squalene--hopene cyclase n=1 Tax=Saccharopolyspora gregorii TaxID=33914 RepID=A0ABP6RGU9_9PSEU
MTTSRAEEVSEAIEAAAEAVFAARRPDGVFDYSEDGLTSTLSTVGAVSALHFADPRGSADLIERGVAWLRERQSDTGGWSMVPGGADEPGPTAVASATLQLVAPESAADAVAAGQRWMLDHGGLEGIPHPEVTAWCRQFYSFVGWLRTSDMRRFPLELAVLRGPFLRLFDLRAPMVCALGLAQAATREQTPLTRLLAKAGTPGALAIIREVYEHEGSTGGWCEDAWVTGLICGGLARAGLGADMVAGAVRWFREQVNEDGSWNSGPLGLTWSMYAAGGLLEAGYATDERLLATREVFLREQQHRPFTAFGCPPGFWGWSGKGWPASLETGEIMSALARFPGELQRPALESGARWLFAQQDSRGSWGLCVRNTKVANSGPCPHMTAQSLDGLLDSGVPAADRRIRRAVRWLASAQRPDGSFESVWYRMHTAGTSAVLQTLVRAGAGGSDAARRAREWLVRAQLPDGSWGTGGDEPGTVEETAWAVGALLVAGGGADGAEVRRGVRWLLDARRPDGSWSAAPVNEYVRHVSRYSNRALANGLALRALARYRDAAGRS